MVVDGVLLEDLLEHGEVVKVLGKVVVQGLLILV